MPSSENNDNGSDALLNMASKVADTLPNPMSMLQGGGGGADVLSACGAKADSHNQETSNKKSDDGEMVKKLATTAIKAAVLL